jgi:hypothetical protein
MVFFVKCLPGIDQLILKVLLKRFIHKNIKNQNKARKFQKGFQVIFQIMLSFFRKKPSESDLKQSPQSPDKRIVDTTAEDAIDVLNADLGYKNQNDLKETIYGNLRV